MKVDFLLAVETEQILVMGTNQISRNSSVVWLINWSEQYFLRDSHRISFGFSDLSTVPDFGAIPDVSEKCPDVQIYRSIYYFILHPGLTCFNNCSQPKKTNYFLRWARLPSLLLWTYYGRNYGITIFCILSTYCAHLLTI